MVQIAERINDLKQLINDTELMELVRANGSFEKTGFNPGDYGLGPFFRYTLDPRSFLLPWESREGYFRLKFRLVLELQPKGTSEELLVERIVNETWRLNRTYVYESALLTAAHASFGALEAEHGGDADFEQDNDLESPDQMGFNGLEAALVQVHTGDPLESLRRQRQTIENSLTRTRKALQDLQAPRADKTSIPAAAMALSFDELERGDQPAKSSAAKPGQHAPYRLREKRKPKSVR